MLASTVGLFGVYVAAHPVFGWDSVVHVSCPAALSMSTRGQAYPVTYTAQLGPLLRYVKVMCTVCPCGYPCGYAAWSVATVVEKLAQLH